MEDRSQRYWQAPSFEGPYAIPADGGRVAPMGHYAGRVCRWRDLDLFYCWHRPILIQGQFAEYDWPAWGTRINTYGRIAPPPLVLRRRADGSLQRGSFPGWEAYRAAPASAPKIATTSLFQEQSVSGLAGLAACGRRYGGQRRRPGGLPAGGRVDAGCAS